MSPKTPCQVRNVNEVPLAVKDFALVRSCSQSGNNSAQNGIARRAKTATMSDYESDTIAAQVKSDHGVYDAIDLQGNRDKYECAVVDRQLGHSTSHDSGADPWG